MGYATIAAFCIAVIIAVTRTILSVMEERDRVKGLVINPDEYKFGKLLKSMIKERFQDIKASFRKRKAKN